MYRFLDFTLDPERLELRRAGNLVDVEPQVFSLLVCLIENRERVDRSGAAQARPDRVPGDLGGGRRSDVTGQLQRDYRARAQGSQRSNAFRSGRSGRSQLGGRSIRRRR